jgi:ubiquinone/menaquinone biosynthesis C-methylase UbiE
MSTPWALGDYHRFANATIWERGAELVRACRIGAGQRVLDVAAGTGNTAIRAAEAGADVVASDLTPRTSRPRATRRTAEYRYGYLLAIARKIDPSATGITRTSPDPPASP